MPDPERLKRDLDALRIRRPGDRPASDPDGPKSPESPGFVAPAAARSVRPRRRGLAYLVALLLVAAAGYALYEKFGPSLSAAEVGVSRVVLREAATPTVILTMAGYVVADRKATVGPQIPGRLTELFVDEGDTVEEGQILARLNDSWYVAQVSAIEARLGGAKTKADRAKQLADKGVGQLDDYDNARFEAAALEAQYAQAKVELDFTVIRAPISGLVIRRDAEIGELVTPGGGPGQIKTAILTLVDPKTFEVEVDVNETDIAKVELGRAGDITLDAYAGKKYPGVVRKIASVANRQKGTIQVKVRFERVDDDVRPEMSARVALYEKAPGGLPGEDVSARARKLFVPTEALLGDEGARFVFVVDESSRARRRAVVVGGRAEGLAEVVSGVSEGDAVVVSGHDRFGDGDPVRIARR